MAGGNANRQRRIEGGIIPREERGEKFLTDLGGREIEFPPLFPLFFLFLKSLSNRKSRGGRIIRGDCSLVNTRASEVKVQIPFDTTHFHPAREDIYEE